MTSVFKCSDCGEHAAGHLDDDDYFRCYKCLDKLHPIRTQWRDLKRYAKDVAIMAYATSLIGIPFFVVGFFVAWLIWRKQ